MLAGIDLPWLILRPTAIYGPREKDIFILFKTLKKGMEPYIGNIPQRLSFVHAKDMASVAVNALFIPQSKKTYNITDGSAYNRYELADIAKQVLNKKTFRFHLPLTVIKLMAATLEATYGMLNKVPVLNKEKVGELTAVNWYCDIHEAIQDLNYQPVYTLQSGVKNTLEWYKQNQWL